MSIEKQQDMEVLGVDYPRLCRLRTVPLLALLTRLNVCLSLSWPDNSFRPRSQVVQLRPGPVLLCAPCGGDQTEPKGRLGLNVLAFGVPNCAVRYEPMKCVPELYQR